MPQEFFKELKEWSERKHKLVIDYLTGFTRILGGSTKGTVYYVDGFAGPGIYDDEARGSPIYAAEYAQTLVGKPYQLHCINVEQDPELFANLEESTQPYHAVTTNCPGVFADLVNEILEKIGCCPAIFFLDPFGLKGIEWECIFPILSRPHITEVLLRVDPYYLSRLAGFLDSDSRDAAGKCQRLTRLYGFPDPGPWARVWHTEGQAGLVNLYMARLLEAMLRSGRKSYVCRYAIRSLEGQFKYLLMFGTRDRKGAVLMSDIVYSRERSYECDVEEYKEELLRRQAARQLSMFDVLCLDPTEDDLTRALVHSLKESIWQEFSGRSALQIEVREAMLSQGWFGKASRSHFTQVFKELEEEGRIVGRSGARSRDYTRFTFGTS
jgi:three-Cys-motif partner protein